MSEIKKETNRFIGYDYKEVSVDRSKISMYLDGYNNFGWIPDEYTPPLKESKTVLLKLKRDRKLINKMELTRLQQHFESCMEEIDSLEHSKESIATIATLTVGIIGTAFIAGSTFAVTHEPPIIWLCILLAIPGFIGWILPFFIHKEIIKNRVKKITPLIEHKYDEIYEICEKGNKLLNK